jgi:hypothetical protein
VLLRDWGMAGSSPVPSRATATKMATSIHGLGSVIQPVSQRIRISLIDLARSASVVGVTGRFVQNRTLSGARQERSRNVAYWPKAGDGSAVSPDVIAGQGDVLPSERGDVCEEIIGDDGSLSTHVLDDAVEVDGVPMDDRGGDEAQA